MSSDHDTLAYRMPQILIRLNQGERLDPRSLAEESGVTLRTIQRDLNERFAYLPLIRSDGRYHIDPTFLGKLSTRDIERFTALAGVRGLFPSPPDDSLRDIFNARIQSALLLKGHSYEDLGAKEHLFRLIEQPIIARRNVRPLDGHDLFGKLSDLMVQNHTAPRWSHPKQILQQP